MQLNLSDLKVYVVPMVLMFVFVAVWRRTISAEAFLAILFAVSPKILGQLVGVFATFSPDMGCIILYIVYKIAYLYSHTAPCTNECETLTKWCFTNAVTKITESCSLKSKAILPSLLFCHFPQ